MWVLWISAFGFVFLVAAMGVAVGYGIGRMGRPGRRG